MSAASEVATTPEGCLLPPLEPVEVWYEVQSTLRIMATLCNTETFTKCHIYKYAPHSTRRAMDDLDRLTRGEHDRLREIRQASRDCELDEALWLHYETEYLMVALNVMAGVCAFPNQSHATSYDTDEILVAMDVLAAQALHRVSGPPPDAYDPPGSGMPSEGPGRRVSGKHIG